LADFGQTSDPSDFLNSGVRGERTIHSMNTTSAARARFLTIVDKELLDVLGFHTVSPVTTVIEAFGSTKMVEVGDNFYLYGNISGLVPRQNIAKYYERIWPTLDPFVLHYNCLPNAWRGHAGERLT
jgi:hypothetical protein